MQSPSRFQKRARRKHFYFKNDICRKAGFPPQQDSICAYLRICRFPSGASAEQRAKLSRSRVNGGISIICRLLICRQRNLVPQTHEKFSARSALNFCESLIYHSISSTGIGLELTSSPTTVPFFMCITLSAICVIAELCVMTITVFSLWRQTSCRSFKIFLPVS